MHVCWKVYKTFSEAREAPQKFRALENEFTVGKQLRLAYARPLRKRKGLLHRF